MTTESELPIVRLYRRDGCHLCDEAREMLQAALERRAAQGQMLAAVREVDIDADGEAKDRFSDTIPVLELNGRRLELATSPRRIESFLSGALDGMLA